jgi:hypothetical protein
MEHFTDLDRRTLVFERPWWKDARREGRRDRMRLIEPAN